MLTPTLKQALEEKEIEALLVTHRENIAYLCGFYGSLGVLLLWENPVLFVDGRYYTQAKEEAKNCEVVWAKNLFWNTVCEQIKNRGLKRLGFEESHLSYHLYRILRDRLRGIRLIPLSDVVERERMIKQAWEIERIEQAQRLSEEALSHCLAFLKEGISEKDLAVELEFYIKKKGGDLAFESIIAFGERSALPHAKCTTRKLKKGDIVLFDIGARVEGYCSDMTRVFFFGKPQEDLIEIYYAVLNAQQKVIDAIRAEMKGSEADEIARSELREKGFADLFTHSLGHGVGREVHELPALAPYVEEKLPPNCVVTVEPGVYIEGIGGVRIEDMVLVMEDGSKDLTKFTKELTIL
ncbi:aminopeptidase P family protein [bacterium]|nr:aminopeptidase P family protein [bacterium]